MILDGPPVALSDYSEHGVSLGTHVIPRARPREDSELRQKSTKGHSSGLLVRVIDGSYFGPVGDC